MNMDTNLAMVFLALLVGEILSSLLAKRFLVKKNEFKQYSELMEAINNTRQDVIAANKLIEEMERINLDLRKQNQELTAENMKLENLATQLKAQLNTALNDIDYWREELKKTFPNWPEKDKTATK